jgi:thiol-disulfide isomerase/thioredoxin
MKIKPWVLMTMAAATGTLALSMLPESPVAQAAAAVAGRLPSGEAMPGFEGAATWLNSAPLTPQKLRGKVVLVDFWTYSCINCIRTLPYVRAWSKKYAADNFVVVGVHTPEFKFEQDLVNVNTAVARFGIDFPVAVDSSRSIWQAWGNRYWPAYYLVDANGKVRYRQFGEGDYDKMEKAIQSLLAEANGRAPAGGLVAPATPAEQMQPDLGNLRSEESYLGYDHPSDFGSPERVLQDRPQQYSVGALGLNSWGLSGRWQVGAEQAVAAGPDAGVAYQFNARDLHLVLGPGAPGRSVRVKVTLDGQPPGEDHGADIDAQGNGVIGATRLYQLVRQRGEVRPRRFEIRFLDQGAHAYAFTFG